MGIMGNVVNTLMNPKKFTETVNNYAGIAANFKNQTPSSIASNSSSFISSNTPGMTIMKNSLKGLSENGVSGAINSGINSGKDILNKSGIKDLISPQRNEVTSSITNKLTNNSVAKLGGYLKSQHHDFGRVSSWWNKLTPGSKLAIGSIGVGAALWGGKILNSEIDKFNKRVHDSLYPDDPSSDPKAALPKNQSFDTEFLNDNKGIADRYKVNDADYINADGKLDVVSRNRDQKLLTKQFNDEFNNYKEFMKRSDPTKYNEIMKNEAITKSSNINDSISIFSNSFSKIPKPLLYGGAAVGGTYAIKKLTDNRRG